MSDLSEKITEQLYDPNAHVTPHHDHNSPEAIQREKRRYFIIFGMLGVLTILTVSVSRLDVSHTMHLVLALTIALVKGSLVAAYFMHLLSERKFIFAVLGLTIFFFAVLLWGPWHHHRDSLGDDLGQPQVQDTTHSTVKTH